MRPRLLIPLVFFIVLPVLAGTEGEVLDRLARCSAGLRDLTADFEQESVREGLKAPVLSRGSMLYRVDPESGAELLLRITEPEIAFIRISAKRMETYLPEDRQLEVIDLEEQGAGSRAVDATILLYGKPRAYWEERFRISVPAPDEIVLEPKEEGLRRQVREIRLRVDPVTALPVRVLYRYDRGEEVTMRFGRVKVNTGLKAKELELHYPKDTEVIRAGGE